MGHAPQTQWMGYPGGTLAALRVPATRAAVAARGGPMARDRDGCLPLAAAIQFADYPIAIGLIGAMSRPPHALRAAVRAQGGVGAVVDKSRGMLTSHVDMTALHLAAYYIREHASTMLDEGPVGEAAAAKRAVLEEIVAALLMHGADPRAKAVGGHPCNHLTAEEYLLTLSSAPIYSDYDCGEDFRRLRLGDYGNYGCDLTEEGIRALFSRGSPASAQGVT